MIVYLLYCCIYHYCIDCNRLNVGCSNLSEKTMVQNDRNDPLGVLLKPDATFVVGYGLHFSGVEHPQDFYLLWINPLTQSRCEFHLWAETSLMVELFLLLRGMSSAHEWKRWLRSVRTSRGHSDIPDAWDSRCCSAGSEGQGEAVIIICILKFYS